MHQHVPHWLIILSFQNMFLHLLLQREEQLLCGSDWAEGSQGIKRRLWEKELKIEFDKLYWNCCICWLDNPDCSCFLQYSALELFFDFLLLYSFLEEFVISLYHFGHVSKQLGPTLKRVVVVLFADLPGLTEVDSVEGDVEITFQVVEL